MLQTTNYNLSQWEKTDRILMEDFNSDNAKIDAALKMQADALSAGAAAQKKEAAAETAARTAADTALSRRLDVLAEDTQTKLLRLLTTTSDADDVVLQLSDVDWSQWSAVHVLAFPKLYNVAAVTYYTNEDAVLGTAQVETHMVLYPMRTGQGLVAGLFLSPVSGEKMFCTSTRFSNLTQIRMHTRPDANNIPQILAGTTVQVWGVK